MAALSGVVLARILVLYLLLGTYLPSTLLIKVNSIHDKTRKKPLMKRSVPFFVSKAGFCRAHTRKKHEKRHVDRSTLMFQTAERRVVC